MEKKNIACRIFKEQIDLIQQLPENERAEVLYKAILDAMNQFDYQNENQFENQNENAYVSVSVNKNNNINNINNISVLGKTVYELLRKNISWKQFSNNYGGKRIGAGKKKPEIPIDTPDLPKPKYIPTWEEVREYARQQNEFAGCGGFPCTEEQARDFYDHYKAQGWIAGNGIPIHDWQHKLREWVKLKYKNKRKEPDDDESRGI